MMKKTVLHIVFVLMLCSLILVLPASATLVIDSTNPAAYTYGVPASISEVTIEFNEPIYYDPTDYYYVHIDDAGSELPISISILDDYTLVISTTIAGYTHYDVHIAGVKSQIDNSYLYPGYEYDFYFQTASTDPAPTVMSTSPADGASNVPADVTITATMDEKINLCIGTVEMVDRNNNPVALLYPDQYFHSTDYINLEIKPVAPLILGETYTVTIQGLDHQGIVMETPYSWSFTVKTSAETTQDLSTQVDELGLPLGIENGLLSKLAAAEKKITQEQYTPARNTLNAFIKQVNAQTGKAITSEQAAELIVIAQQIIASIPGK